MEPAITASSAPTYSGLASNFAASRLLPFCSASSHQAARSSAFTSRTWVLGWRSAHCRVTPNTFSGLLRQISRSVMTGTPMPLATACWFQGSPTL
ncbi:hypothetical protein D3C86_1600660 [compost metagenome]